MIIQIAILFKHIIICSTSMWLYNEYYRTKVCMTVKTLYPPLPLHWINDGQPHLAYQKRKRHKVCTQSQHCVHSDCLQSVF